MTGDFPQHLEKLFPNAEEVIYHGIKSFFLLKEATTESFYLFKVTSAIECKKNPPNNFPILLQNEHIKLDFH